MNEVMDKQKLLCAKSSLFLFFIFCRVIKSEITKIHLNLSIAVGVAQVLFLAAGSENLIQREVTKIVSHSICLISSKGNSIL